MAKEEEKTPKASDCFKRGKDCNCRSTGGGDAVYGLGLIGALVYYLGHATTFWMGVLGILKAFVWPAFLVYHLLQFLHL